VSDAPASVLDGQPRALDPRVRTAWTAASAGTAVAAGIAATVVAYVAGAPTWLVALLPAAAALLAVLGAIAARLQWAAYRYRAGEEAVEIVHGVVIRTLSVVPYRRIQQIDVRRGPVERRLGLATLVLRTAAATSDATIPGLADEDANALRTVLLARAGVGDAV
jgi:membrane protein YdbS with pleckstrin-like domain